MTDRLGMQSEELNEKRIQDLKPVIQFIMIGIIGEYVGKSFMQIKGRPTYIISEQSRPKT